VPNPAALFLTRREGEQPLGVVVAPVYEGTRVLLVEIQSLVVPAKGGISRVFSDRIDAGRVSRMAAVLEKHLKARLADQDLYVNVGGGLRIAEVGIELPLAIALYSARLNQPVPALTAVVGEVSLAGEVRPVPHLDRRARAVAEMSFARLVHPAGVELQGAPEGLGRAGFAGLCPAATLAEAVRACFTAPA
jgi:DNA repair protein RadA/Sms